MRQLIYLVAILLLAACAPITPIAEQTGAPLPTPTREAAGNLDTPTPIPTLSTSSFGQIDPTQIKLQLIPVVDGLENPVFVTHAGDGSGWLFVVEKPGRIRVVVDGNLRKAPFLDLTERVKSSGNEQGLLGLAFAPDYASSGLFFVNYTDLGGDTVIARFQANADHELADPATESMVLQIDQPASNHNGGMLAFGADGKLWIGTGDGGGANDTYANGQNPDTLLGKFLRIDVTSDPAQPYTIPADNPWLQKVWNGVDVRDEIWAMGLRNPWRYSFDRTNGDLWIGDVGQNQWEEINTVPAGSAGGINFGWPLMEATHCTGGKSCDHPDLTLPVLEYSHQGHCSVVGGYVYRGQTEPSLQGLYVYGDYCSGAIWLAASDGATGWQSALALDSDLTLSSFGEDEMGELYAVDYSGSVQRIAVER